jgi:hypothetical protein
MQHLLERLNDIGFERTRRAVASLALSLFLSFYLIVALLLYMNGASELVPFVVALAACYGVASMCVAAEWFWGRWFATGLAWSGLTLAVFGIVMSGEANPVVVAQLSLHGLVILTLAGKKMAARYDDQPEWRQRHAMDEFGVARLRKTVTRAAAMLPGALFWALGPKDPNQGMAVAAVALVGAGLAVGGLRGVLRLRTAGVVALGAAALAFVGLDLATAPPHLAFGPMPLETLGGVAFVRPALELGQSLAFLARGFVPALLLAAILPFVGPAARYLRARR